MGAKNATALLLCAAGVVGTIFIGYRFLLLDGMGGRTPCLSEEWEDIQNLLGLRLQVEYTNCDTLAKGEAVSVYVVEAQEGLNGANSSKQRALLFRYDPISVSDSRPIIEVSGDQRIVIFVQNVSSVTFQRRKWRNISLDYRIANNKNP